MEWTPAAQRVLERRYLAKDAQGRIRESPDAMLRRVARSVAKAESRHGADAERWERAFHGLMDEGRFLPNSPTLMNAGRRLGQLAACFVLPVPDSIPGIFDTVKLAAVIHQSGGGTGFGFSRLRPRGDYVSSTGGEASGPVSFMRVIDAATEAIKQGGKRRGANMGVLSVHHPDVREFISCKQAPGALQNFNISVGLTAAFFDALDAGRDFTFTNPRTGSPAGGTDARGLFGQIAAAAHGTGEPGVLFLDTINAHNPTPSLGQIEATNPCSEQTLLPYEACTLGSLALPRFLRDGEYDWDGLDAAVRTSVRFLDDVVTVNRVPVARIRRMCDRTRKIGIGVMGFADALALRRVAYGSKAALDEADRVMSFVQRAALGASLALAEERGVYPAHEKGPAARNAARTTVAPTGTLSILADVTPGIEPPFALVYRRRALDGDVFDMRMPAFETVAREEGFWSEDLAARVARTGGLDGTPGVPEWAFDVFRTATELPAEAHVRMQAAFQAHVDAGISKTINLPADATVEDVADAFELAHRLGCKGITVYRQGSRPEQVLSTRALEEGVQVDACGQVCS